MAVLDIVIMLYVARMNGIEHSRHPGALVGDPVRVVLNFRLTLFAKRLACDVLEMFRIMFSQLDGAHLWIRCNAGRASLPILLSQQKRNGGRRRRST